LSSTISQIRKMEDFNLQQVLFKILREIAKSEDMREVRRKRNVSHGLKKIWDEWMVVEGEEGIYSKLKEMVTKRRVKKK